MRKIKWLTLIGFIMILSACGKDESVKTDVNNVSETEPKEKIEVAPKEMEEEVIDPQPKNDLSAEVDIIMKDFNIILVEHQENLNEYLLGTSNLPLEDYQMKELIETGESVEESMYIIKLNTITEGDKKIAYLFEELKKYQDIRFQALKKYIDEPNDYDLEIIKANTVLVSDIALKMIDIRAKGIEE
ncbi:hypothetical protein ABE61_20700 [Lysinibacillus sphaericus]|uniref:hypothetical protein n=1 Tax=Lysinibacillus sphaericus TaxID=1421 RepID=UPI0018CD6434|nr:hypothetical protein [Lysinibacillus sphaericus]MBG9456381.1 hypothetical protein [Lysinibacillus sphaericus]MBG9479527.1 hypothetical protein [Lysinibacillus sphaericus]MBG9591824.1 hypothetical protein [Lysinibacillus sphaericus]